LPAGRAPTSSLKGGLGQGSRVPTDRVITPRARVESQGGELRPGSGDRAKRTGSAFTLAPFLADTLNTGCVPDDCAWWLSKAEVALWWPGWVLWLLVFGSNGKVQLQALAPRAELVHAQSRRRFCARCAEAVSRDKKEGDESSGFGKDKLYFHSCEPYSTSNKTEY
jgi:hypothetical protein